MINLVIQATYIGIPPNAAESNGRIIFITFNKVAGFISYVNSRRDESVAKTEGCALKYVTDSRMQIWLVPGVRRHRFVQQCRQILVHYDVLKERKKVMPISQR